MQMRVALCARETPTKPWQRGCTPPGDTQAMYFGADQPRVTAEMTIPWTYLGVQPPIAGASLKAEMAMTSWHNERWMSLSGKPPASDMEDPAGWHVFTLGDGVAVSPAPARQKPG